jgi:hypothetical protein
MGFALVTGFEDRIWKNLNESGLLSEIIEHKDNADVKENYHHVAIWCDLNSSMWLQIYIMHIDHSNEYRQPVTPELHCITDDVNMQAEMTRKIWHGVYEEDIRLTVDTCIRKFTKLYSYQELSTNEMVGLRRFQQKACVDVQLLARYAQCKITPTDFGCVTAEEIVKYGKVEG